MQSIENKIKNRIYGHGRGWAFFKNDFSDLGSRSSIDTALHRLKKKGVIRRVARGIYDYPKYSKILDQELGPDIDQIAHAYARKFGWCIQVTGNTALNLLGLSTQIPTRYVYQTDGKTKSYKIGKNTLEFKKASFKDMRTKYPESALLVQALRALNKRALSEAEHNTIRAYFTEEKQKKILKDTRYVTSWIYEEIREILRESNGSVRKKTNK